MSYGNRSKDDTGVSEVQTLCREVGRDVDERFRGVEGVLDEIKRKVEFEERWGTARSEATSWECDDDSCAQNKARTLRIFN